MHMYGGSAGIVLLRPGTAATLPDGQTAPGLGCLPLAPDDLIDYGYCQSP